MFHVKFIRTPHLNVCGLLNVPVIVFEVITSLQNSSYDLNLTFSFFYCIYFFTLFDTSFICSNPYLFVNF